MELYKNACQRNLAMLEVIAFGLFLCLIFLIFAK